MIVKLKHGISPKDALKVAKKNAKTNNLKIDFKELGNPLRIIFHHLVLML